jgi:hypothetical protein
MAYLKSLPVFWLFLFVASSLSAQAFEPLPPGSSVALLRPGGDVEALGLEQTTIEAAINALHSMRYLAIGPEQVAEELKLVGRGSCNVLGACERTEVLEALGVDAVASVVVWLDEDGKRPNHVFVNLTRPANWGEGEVTIGNQGLDGAVSHAIALALKDTLVRHHVVLRVEAMPDEAQVEIDHRGVGKAPAEVKVVPGKRVVTVSAKGYETVSSYVDVPPSTLGRYIYKIKLAQSSKHASGLDQSKIERDIDLSIDRFDRFASTWNYIIASGLFVGSAALLTPALINAINDGDCYEEDAYGRCNRYVFGVQSTLLMLGGVFALGGGLAFILFEPIKDDPSVSIQAKPTSIAVTGEF